MVREGEMLDITLDSKTSEKIEHRSLSSEAAKIIRNKIIKGDYPQGGRITEEEISNTLGVSRVCIRESLMLLANEGLVKRVRNKYTEVVRFTLQDIKEINSLRVVIEHLCIEECLKANKTPLQELERIQEMMKSIRAEEPIDIMKWINTDLLFHEVIVTASGHSRAQRVWKSLKSQIEALLYPIIMNNPSIIDSSDEYRHSEIVEALASKNLNRTKQLIEKHIVSSEVFIMNDQAIASEGTA
jgi:DNA-binding GntR family transcriptional regulator